MATTYLTSGETNFTVSNNNTTLIGSTGTESVTIASGVTGVVLDQNTESVTLAGNSSTYTFQQTGNVVNVYAADGTTLVATLPLTVGATDKSMTFDDGEKALVMSSTDGSMTVGGDEVSATTPTVLTVPTPVVVAGQTFALTSGSDDWTGASGADTFNASLFFNSGTGTNINSLQNQDKIDGGTGIDTLNFSYNAGAATVQPAEVTSVEIINVSHTGTGALVLAGANITGVTTINSSGAANTFTANAGFEALTTVGISNTSQAHAYGTTTAATSGATDTLTMNVSGLGTAATHTITTGGVNGYETLLVNSTGATANLITDIAIAVGTSLATFTVTGSADLRLATAIDNGVTTVSAADFTGGLRAIVGTGAVAVTTGSGADRITFNTATYAATDSIDLGEGTTDELRLATADADNVTAAAAATNVSNVEQLGITNAVAGIVNTTVWGNAFDTVNALAGFGNNTSLTVASGTNVVQSGTDSTNNARAFIVTGSSTTDSMTMTLNDNDMDGVAIQTFTGIETLNIVSNVNATGAAADGGINVLAGATTMGVTAAQELINVTGTEALTFTLAVTADKIDASTFAHNLVMGAATVAAGGAEITTFSGADVLFGSVAADILSSGAGNDTITAGNGVDLVDVGTGSDTLSVLEIATVNRGEYTGFTATGTFDATNEVDQILFGAALDAVGVTLADGTATAGFTTDTTVGSVTLTATTEIVELSWEFSSGVDLNAGTVATLDGTALLSAIGATSGVTAGTITAAAVDEGAVFIAYQGGKAFMYFADGTAGNTGVVAADIDLIGVFNGVGVGDFDASNFN